MKSDKKKGVLYLLVVIAAIALCTFITLVGVGKGHKGSAKNIRLGLDLAGGVSITYQTVEENPSQEAMADTLYRMQKRAEHYSTEAQVYKEGDNRITIDIPGAKDANEILQELGRAGAIEFQTESGETVIGGADIETAQATVQQNSAGINEHVVKLVLNGRGTKKFAKATEENLQRQIAIIYDGEVISAPRVEAVITDGQAVINGMENMEEAENLASTIRIGALPLELKELQSRVVGAKLGLQAIDTSLMAAAIGFALVILFMLIMYRIPGVAASIALVLYIVAELVILNGLDVTLTLPGVAGIILSIGMAVDANVIIFTRIREELAAGKTVRSAMKMGFDKALSAIVDGNVTTLIVAVVLYLKGSGTIKGFATTLAIGIILSMFTAFVVTKYILLAFYHLGCDNEKLYGVQKERRVIDFVGNIKKTYGISIVVIAIGIVMLFVNQSSIGDILNYGLDFRGGTSTEITLNDEITSDLQKQIEASFQEIVGSNVETSLVTDQNAVNVKTDEMDLAAREKVTEMLKTNYGVEEGSIQMENISATVSGEMKMDAVVSVLISILCMLVYIWFRFKDVTFGAGAVIALIHDVLCVLMVYAVARISVGNTFIACMLTIVGYSINATIVVYDRIRENKGMSRNKDALKDVVNRSITDTLSRSINTSITTLIMVIMLVILGVDSVREFAIPLTVGVIAGAWSSVCISGTIWYVMRSRMHPDVKK